MLHPSHSLSCLTDNRRRCPSIHSSIRHPCGLSPRKISRLVLFSHALRSRARAPRHKPTRRGLADGFAAHPKAGKRGGDFDKRWAAFHDADGAFAPGVLRCASRDMAATSTIYCAEDNRIEGAGRRPRRHNGKATGMVIPKDDRPEVAATRSPLGSSSSSSSHERCHWEHPGFAATEKLSRALRESARARAR